MVLNVIRVRFPSLALISSSIAFIKVLRTMGIDVIVAPYEADAQLAYLNRMRIADYVITEDSDLVLFGCHHVRYAEQMKID